MNDPFQGQLNRGNPAQIDPFKLQSLIQKAKAEQNLPLLQVMTEYRSLLKAKRHCRTPLVVSAV
jgi:hypothetical protein